MARHAWNLAVLIVPLALITLAGSYGSSVFVRDVTTMLVTLVVVVGLYVFVGNSGVLSFGHVSFMSIGAYVAAWLTVPPFRKEVLFPHLPQALRNADVPDLPTAVVSGLAAAIFALVIGFPLMRISGMAASLALFAVLLIVNNVASNWDDWTRGTLAVLGVPTNTDLLRALIGAAACIAVAYAFQQTKVALRLRASREDEIAAKAIGVDIARDRHVALVVSGFIVGVGGFLFAQYQGSFNPDAFYLGLTFTTIAMLVIGGMNSLAGAITGTVVVSALSVGLRNIESGVSLGPVVIPAKPGVREVGLGLLMLLILLFRPKGITHGREAVWPGWILPSIWGRNAASRATKLSNVGQVNEPEGGDANAAMPNAASSPVRRQSPPSSRHEDH